MARIGTTSYNIKIDKKMKIERLAMEASLKVGRTIKWTELMDILVTEFGKDAQQMIIHREAEKSETK
ncbi:hypothetical protein [Kingella negevensis]|uniref:Uncharacterized protein n=1 Tax=Kingella negevensis TaxID=1522312 RepID=A0A238HHP2_9NEIS|nr:hypothetical protein [Kingella negevensis]MDK4685705.1 hypothetical protein [Kingella negevensis]MDK4689730.1 hypothetical protein [Kingella negevensis]MDK4698385.1 hypothetical protein [Kingella negevensis]MDK4708842.1 hypothetical protein [Kingella negevensis]MDK4711041.1 hypothetical protein [Kingella negevensis]